jgi:exodeoxyribonuclease-3
MKIVTWNVNSIKARTEHVQRFLARVQPDVLLLQELKGLEFPSAAFEGYHTEAVGQKAYNGVAALLDKKSISSFVTILNKLPGDEDDEQARYLEIETAGLRVINIYLPNGNPWPGEKFDYKMRWMDRLYNRLKELREAEIPFVIAGDFNVIPEARDCWDPTIWMNDALYRIETRQKFRALLNLGLTDAFRTLNQKDHQYTFWDYQAGSWQKDWGIRIDHFLLSPPVTDRLSSCIIDKEPRGEDSPSDHTPVIVTLTS